MLKSFQSKENIVLKVGLVCMIIFFIFGCTSKEEAALMKEFEKNKSYHNKLQKTEKSQFYSLDEGITKVLLTATYLYKQKIKENKNKDEVFVVGMYAEESEIQSLNEEGFSLTLDGIEAKNIKTLDENSSYLKDVSFVAPWSQFYLVRFPHTSKKSFYLILKSEQYGKSILHFAKVAKYVMKKKAF